MKTDLDAALDGHGLNAGRVHLDVTEHALVDQAGNVLELLRSLAGDGVRLEVDDFATGYSSLTSLQRLPIDRLKVDRSVIAGVCVNDSDRVIVQAVLQLAHALDVAVVAEGVETAEQLGLLRELGCEYGQGHLWGCPLVAEDLFVWFSSRRPVRPISVAAGKR